MYVYLPSEEIVEEWKSLAKNARTSISKFVFEHVENSLKQEEENSYVSRAELIKQMKELEEENAKLKEENRILKIAYERLDMSSEDFCNMMLEEAHVLLTPGSAFGKNGERHFRLSYATSMKNLEEGTEKIGETIGRYISKKF